MTAAVATAAPVPAPRRAFIPVGYPAAIGATFVLSLFVASGASPFSALRMIVVAIAGCLLLTSLAGAAMRDRDRGGLFALVLILLLIAGQDPPRLAALTVGAAALIVERIVSYRRPPRIRWSVITRVANVAAVIALLALGLKALQEGTLASVLYDIRAEGPPFLRTERPGPVTTGDHPDIYVVLLDGYLRPDKQAALFGHDDGAFVEALEDRGFEVATDSRSNYLLTVLSFSSALNIRHLDSERTLAALPVTSLLHVRAARQLLNENEVFRELHTLGYETVALSSGFEEVALRQADVFIDTGQLNEVEILTFRHTALGALVAVFAPDMFADAQRSRIDAAFTRAAALAAEDHDRPRFVFIHVPSPHAPVVFDADGGPVPARDLRTFYEEGGPARGLTREEFGRLYSGQVEYLNRRTLELVDRLTASSASPPVVLVLSDHGSASGVDFNDLEHSDLDERSSNLFAAYTPGREKVFDDRITLVNVFGRLFNAYFGTRYPLQPDTVYRWTPPSVFDVVPLPSFSARTGEP